jgi:hypothetical protein
VGGERVEMRELEDGDEITVGRFHLYFITVTGARGRSELGAPGAAV